MSERPRAANHPFGKHHALGAELEPYSTNAVRLIQEAINQKTTQFHLDAVPLHDVRFFAYGEEEISNGRIVQNATRYAVRCLTEHGSFVLDISQGFFRSKQR